jgi:hypothetical protein
MTNMRTVLADFVRWAWIVQLLIFYFMVIFWRVVEWYMELKEPSANQALVLTAVGTMLPTLVSLFIYALGRIKPPE